MIDAVQEMLVAHGWVDPEGTHSATVILSGDAVVAHKLLVRDAGVPTLFVKFSDSLDLETEACRTETAWQRFPKSAPRFIGYCRRKNLNAMVTAAVERERSSTLMLSKRGSFEELAEKLVAFFRMQRATAEGAPGGEDWQESYMRHFHEHPLRDRAADELRHLVRVTSGLHPQDQHGDLALNNISLSATGDITIFDWEDYGVTSMPGLDAFTMLRSIGQALEATRRGGLLKGWSFPSGMQRTFLTRACDAIGMDVDAFLSCRIGYSFLFRFLKTTYSRALQEKLEHQLKLLVVDGANRNTP